VYSYGITCAELLTGEYPYPEFRRTDLLSTILQGVRPQLPDDCPVRLKKLIVRCWETRPCNRPTFFQVCEKIEGLFTEESCNPNQCT